MRTSCPLAPSVSPGLRDAQLGDCAQIARVQFADFHQLPPLHDREVGHPLGFAASVVFNRSIGLERSR